MEHSTEQLEDFTRRALLSLMNYTPITAGTSKDDYWFMPMYEDLFEDGNLTYVYAIRTNSTEKSLTIKYDTGDDVIYVFDLVINTSGLVSGIKNNSNENLVTYGTDPEGFSIFKRDTSGFQIEFINNEYDSYFIDNLTEEEEFQFSLIHNIDFNNVSKLKELVPKIISIMNLLTPYSNCTLMMYFNVPELYNTDKDFPL